MGVLFLEIKDRAQRGIAIPGQNVKGKANQSIEKNQIQDIYFISANDP